MKDLQVLPLIPISAGEVVHIDYQYGALAVHQTEPFPLRDIVIPLHEAYGVPLIMDMDGVVSYDPQLELLKNIAKSFPIWFDGGARFSEDIIDYFVANVETGCISTKNMDSVEEMEEAVFLSEQLSLLIDVHKGKTIAHNKKLGSMELEELANMAEEMEIASVSYIDYGELLDEELDPKVLEPLLNRNFQLFVGGLSQNRVDEWAELGLTGVFLYYRSLFQYNNLKQGRKPEELPTTQLDESRAPGPAPNAAPS